MKQYSFSRRVVVNPMHPKGDINLNLAAAEKKRGGTSPDTTLVKVGEDNRKGAGVTIKKYAK